MTGLQVVERKRKKTWSNYPLRNIGWGSDGEVLLAEEDRESHIHILGAPGQGKSKFLEFLICGDIANSQWRVTNNKPPAGSCLLDSSPNGDTAYSVLRYCIANNIDKVLLIDPRDGRNHYKTLPVINPLNPKAAPTVVAQSMMDTMRIVWGDKGHEGTAKIDRYLPALISVLRKAHLTLREAIYFTEHSHPRYTDAREAILNKLHPDDRDRIILESVFAKNQNLFDQIFASTIRRLAPINDPLLELIVGSAENPIDFVKMIREGWVILVVLDKTNLWGSEQERFLGTLVLNQLIDAIAFLRNETPWKGVYYVYIDEAGKYATSKVADVLDYSRHLGMRFTFAHQRFNQIEDLNVRSAIKSCKIKIVLNTPHREDRDEMVRMMYGGDLSDREVSYELMNLPKQHAAIKINMNPPRKTRLADVHTPEVSDHDFEAAKRQYYAQAWYRSPEQIRHEINARFRTEQLQREPGGFVGKTEHNLKGARSRKAPNRQTTRPPAPTRQQGKQSETYFDKKIREDP